MTNVKEFAIRHKQLAEDDRITVLQVSGSLDNSRVNEMTEAFESLVEEERYFVLLDLEDVTFISSAIVGVFMGGRRKLGEKCGNLIVCGLSKELSEKVVLMGADRVFRMYPDLEVAINEYNWEYDLQGHNIQLDLPSTLGYVPAVRRLASTIAAQKGFSRKDAFRVETIVDELCNNAVEHSDKNQTKFSIELYFDREKLELVVRNRIREEDRGQVANVREKFNAPEVDDESIRGRGLALVKMLSDNVTVEFDEQGTTVHVVKMREG